MNQNEYKNTWNKTIQVSFKNLVEEYNFDETSVHNFIYLNDGFEYEDVGICMTHFGFSKGDKELPGYLSEYYWEINIIEGERYMGYVSYNTSSPHALWLCNFQDDDEEELEEEFDWDLIKNWEEENYFEVDEFALKYEDDCECDRCGKVWNSKCIQDIDGEHKGYVVGNNAKVCGFECLKLELSECYEETLHYEEDLDEEELEKVWKEVVDSGYLYEETGGQNMSDFPILSIEEGTKWSEEGMVNTRAIMV